MTNLMRVALSVAIILTSVTSRAEQMRDGTWWRKQPETVKFAYVLGALDHVAAGKARAAGSTQAIVMTAPVREACKRLDAFYGPPSNRTMHVQFAIPLVLIWIAAGPGATLESAMQKMREQSAPQ